MLAIAVPSDSRLVMLTREPRKLATVVVGLLAGWLPMNAGCTIPSMGWLTDWYSRTYTFIKHWDIPSWLTNLKSSCWIQNVPMRLIASEMASCGMWRTLAIRSKVSEPQDPSEFGWRQWPVMPYVWSSFMYNTLTSPGDKRIDVQHRNLISR